MGDYSDSYSVVFRENSSLLPILEKYLDDSELRVVISSLVLKNPTDALANNPKLNAIYLLAKNILEYENFCEGGMDIL